MIIIIMIYTKRLKQRSADATDGMKKIGHVMEISGNFVGFYPGRIVRQCLV